MMKNSYQWTAVLLSVTMGACATRTSQTTGEFRAPTPQEWNKAVETGRSFALADLGLTQEALGKLKADRGVVWKRGGRDILHLQFYDPEIFPEDRYAQDGLFEAMMGGFPSYFSVSIDVQTGQVVDHYACEE